MTREQGARIKLLTELRLSVRHWPPITLLTKMPDNDDWSTWPPEPRRA